MTSPYNVLGLVQTATLSEVKKRYRSLALKYHPDKNSSKDAHKKFCRIQAAYEFLVERIPEHKPAAGLQSRNDLWHKEEARPSFRYVNGLGTHLHFDAQDLQTSHYELVAMLRDQGRGGHEQYTDFVALIISNAYTECRTLQGRCLTLNGDAWKETELWTQRKREVKALQNGLTTLLTSLHVMRNEHDEIKGELKGKVKLTEEEWEVVLEMLKKMAHFM